MKQGILPYKYEEDKTKAKMTMLGGLPTYLDLAIATGLIDSIKNHMQVCSDKDQGWSDVQIIMSLVMLNLAGGNCVEDLQILEADQGFAQILRQAEMHGLSPQERQKLEERFRGKRHRTVPSPSPVFRYLQEFHNATEESKREQGKAFIPEPTTHLKSLMLVNRDMIELAQQKSPQKIATVDMDATLSETHKKQALYSYKGYKSYQPLNTYWYEQDMMLHSEFRDGNVPAGYEQLRVFQEALAGLPEGVEKVYLRSDTAGYQIDLLRYCAIAKNERFGQIEFAIGADVTPAFKKACSEVKTDDWHKLYKEVKGQLIDTNQEYAEVCFVPNWIGCKKSGAEYRFLAIRELLSQKEKDKSKNKELPFQTQKLGDNEYKIFGIITNRIKLPGDELIKWQRERCGKSEEAHGIIKNDLAGGQFPSKYFGANAAWWLIALLAFNLNALMKLLILPKSWIVSRFKAIRFSIINIAGRVMKHARKLCLRISKDHPSRQLLVKMRQRILALAQPP